MSTDRTPATLQLDPIASTPRPAGVEPAAPETRARGSALGRYVVLDHLGAGGMGVVYLAWDPELDRKIAVKVIRVAGARPDQRRERRERLLREAHALAKISDPAVVAIYDVGREGDELFLAMELVAGRTLRTWRDETRPGWREVLAAMRQAGRGLAAVHAAGLVHRDFKPDNVLVDDKGRARVADFGLARVDEAALSEDGDVDSTPGDSAGPTSCTAAGVVMGSPAYMAPELSSGVPADARSDQYAFCVTLWELLYGVRPFGGATHAELLAAKRKLVLGESPPDRAVPAWVRKIVVRGLAPDPDARWPSMSALIGAIERDPSRRRALGLALGLAAIVPASAVAMMVPPADRCAAADARLAEVWNADAAARVQASFSAVGLSFGPATAERVTTALDRWAEGWVAAQRDACEANVVRGEQSDEMFDLRSACLGRGLGELQALVGVLEDADAEAIVGAPRAVDDLPRPEECGDLDRLRATAIVLSEADAAKVAVASAEVASARAEASASRHAQALARIEAGASALGDVQHPVGAELALLRCTLHERRGEYEAALAAAEQAAVMAEATGDDATKLKARTKLALVEGKRLSRHDAGRRHLALARATWARTGRPVRAEIDLLETGALLAQETHELDDAMESLERALELAREHSTTEEVLGLVATMAHLEVDGGRFAEAESRARQGLRRAGEELGDDHPVTSELRQTLAVVLGRQDRGQEAEEILLRVRDDLEAIYGHDHVRVADVQHSLGVAASQRGDFDRARELYEDALRIRTITLGPLHPRIADSHNTMGVLDMRLGRLSDAAAHYEAALEIRRKVYGPDSPDVAKALTNRAAILQQLGRRSEAERDLRKAVAIRESQLGPDHVDVAYSLEVLGNLQVTQKRLDEARVSLERALAIREAAVGTDNPTVGVAAANLAVLELTEENWDAARALCERSLEIKRKGYGEDHPDLVYAYNCLAHARLGAGEPAAAIEPLRRSRALLPKIPDKHALWGETLFAIARATALSGGSRSEAVALAREAREHYATFGDGRRDALDEIDAWLSGR